MSHLGSRLSALVDGQLAPPVAERALAHVARCATCSAELAAARSARRALVGAEDVVPTSDLTARLLLLAGEAYRAGPALRDDPFVVPLPRSTAGRSTETLLGAGRGMPAYAMTGDVVRRRPVRRRAVGSFASLGAVVVALFVMGDSPWVVPSDKPTHALALLGQATPLPLSRTSGATFAAAGTPSPYIASTSTAPGLAPDYLAWLREHSWTCPASLPDGWSVTSVRYVDESVIEVDIAGPDGTIVVTERRARLDTDALAASEQIDIGGRIVYVLSDDPWHAAWQSGDTVVEVVAARPSNVVTALVEGFPTDGYDTGVPARITRGWGTMTQAILQP